MINISSFWEKVKSTKKPTYALQYTRTEVKTINEKIRIKVLINSLSTLTDYLNL